MPALAVNTSERPSGDSTAIRSMRLPSGGRMLENVTGCSLGDVRGNSSAAAVSTASVAAVPRAHRQAMRESRVRGTSGSCMSRNIHSSCVCRSRADCQRSSGSTLRHRCTTSANRAGSATPQVAGGRTPVAMSCSSKPSAYTSARASAGPPCNCSGAMYAGVPTAVPAMVRVASCREVPPVEAASPKSSTFTPLLPSMMLPGFRSRWTMPRACAAASAPAICAPNSKARSTPSRPRASRSARVSPR